jgi:hypothetical protein
MRHIYSKFDKMMIPILYSYFWAFRTYIYTVTLPDVIQKSSRKHELHGRTVSNCSKWGQFNIIQGTVLVTLLIVALFKQNLRKEWDNLT